MDTIVQHIIFLLYNAIFISCSRNFLVLPSSISQLSAVYRIIQNAFYKGRCKCVQCVILSLFLFISMLVQPCSNHRDSHISMNKFIIDQTNNFRFILCKEFNTSAALRPNLESLNTSTNCTSSVPFSILFNIL